MTDDDV